MGFFDLFKSKGKIDIILDKYNFSPGKTISGTVTLMLKNPLLAKALTIQILGQRRTSRGRRGFGVSKSVSMGNADRRQIIFSFIQPLDREKEYPANNQLTYPFKIKLPADLLKRAEAGGTFGKVLQVAQALSGSMSRVTWTLEARLDVKGFDMAKKVQINVA